MKAMLTPEPGSWRPAFQLIGAIGIVWVVLWLATIRRKTWDDQPESPETDDTDSTDTQAVVTDTRHDEADASFLDAIFSRKFLVLLIVVMSINACWHLFRVWLPKFLVNGRGYEEGSMFEINFWFNIMTDVGCLSMGFLTALLCRHGMSVHRSRCLVFGICSVMVATGGLIPWLPQGPWLLLVLFVVGAGALGLFPCYYSFSQELTRTHQGKVSGVLGTFAWVTASPLHPLFGRWVDTSGSYDQGMAFASLAPLVALFALLTLWPREELPSTE
jgi:ACS family hexuronate transporter-like MFS transporter